MNSYAAWTIFSGCMPVRAVSAGRAMCIWYFGWSLGIETTPSRVHCIGELLSSENIPIKERWLPFLVSTYDYRVRKNGDGFTHGVIVVGPDEYRRSSAIVCDLSALVRSVGFAICFDSLARVSATGRLVMYRVIA